MLNECVLLVFGEGEIDLISSVEAGRRNISAGLDLPVLCFSMCLSKREICSRIIKMYIICAINYSINKITEQVLCLGHHSFF